MKIVPRALLILVAIATAALGLCGPAAAANVIVGPSLTGSWTSYECGVPTCISFNTEFSDPRTSVTSPVTGAVVRFSVVGAETEGTYKLRTVLPFKEASSIAIFHKASAPVAGVPGPGVQTYSTVLPITAGEGVALVWGGTGSLGFATPVGAGYTEWETEPAEGTSAAGSHFAELAGFNVEVQPAPTVTSLGTASGPLAGGTAVAIAGTDFANVTGVSFGDTPATSFAVSSEGLLTAVAPARPAPGSVSVTVATVAGKANAPQLFTYEAPPVLPIAPPASCVVPNLKGKKLKAARAALEKAKCKLGKVTKLGGATAKSGTVGKQGVKAGAKVVRGTAVAVTLKPPTAAHKRHGHGKRAGD